MFYLPSEFLKLLKAGETIQKSELLKRENYYILWLQNSNINFFTGKAAKTIEARQLPHKKIVKTEKIQGSVAFRGKVVGKVKIVNTSADIKKMQHGDILVSIMTTPRLLPAIKKSAAMVTDEGGITCHAAIVSRELNIPCVIGTKIASQVLKEGIL